MQSEKLTACFNTAPAESRCNRREVGRVSGREPARGSRKKTEDYKTPHVQSSPIQPPSRSDLMRIEISLQSKSTDLSRRGFSSVMLALTMLFCLLIRKCSQNLRALSNTGSKCEDYEGESYLDRLRLLSQPGDEEVTCKQSS